MANRHLSRSIVLQTLFEWDFLQTQEGTSSSRKDEQKVDGLNEEIKKMLKKNLKEFAPGLEDDVFVFSLMDEILKKRVKIDEIIEKAAPDWPIDKISIVDRNILRIGLTELLFGDKDQVPPKVAINESIELAKTFGGENSSKFVNGVLGAVYKEIGEPGKDHKKSDDKKKKSDSVEAVDVSKLPVESLGGALVYTKKDNEILFALVHDVFGYWTLSKGKVGTGESIEDAVQRALKEETGLEISIEEILGSNEYVATHPEKGKTLKKVEYFLASSEYRELVLENSGGLDGARWFSMSEVPELRIYNDIIPLIAKAVEIISSKKL